MELSSDVLPAPVRLRLSADFEVKVNLKATAGFSCEQSTLLAAILPSSETLREVARMAVEIDLASISGSHLMGKYTGPSNEELLDCVLPCLPDSERPYWVELRSGSDDIYPVELLPVFFTFETSLQGTGIEAGGRV
jgi:hypothetical protein